MDPHPEMRLPSFELGYTNARHTAESLVATVDNQDAVKQLRRVLNACVRDAIQCSRLVLDAIHKADFADQWKLLAYALAYHDLPSKEDGEEMIAMGMTREDMERQIHRIIEPVKSLTEAIVFQMINLETAAKKIWELIKRYDSEPTQVVILTAFLHTTPGITPYVEFNCLRCPDEDWRGFDEKHPEFLEEARLILRWPGQNTARMSAIRSLIGALPEKDHHVAWGKIFCAIESNYADRSVRSGILGQLLGGLFGEGGPPSGGSFRIDIT